jgi:hypothetical protein
VERTLIALGLVLAVAGLLVAYNGYVYVNVDRGPPTMVSGVLTFGFGLVIVALGFVLRELQAISADASKLALLLAKSRSAAYAAEPAPKPEPKPSPMQKPLPPLAPFETPSVAPEAIETAAPDRAAPDLAAPDHAADEAQSDLFPIETKPEKPRGSLFSRRPAAGPDEPAKPAPRPIAPLSWMSKPGKAGEPPVKSEDEWLNQAVAAEAVKAAREPPAAGQPVGSGAEGGEKPAEPATARSDVMGHYEAHGAHYTMYADGSIEAETQHGLYRFASIEDLKRFIEGEDSGDATAAD